MFSSKFLVACFTALIVVIQFPKISIARDNSPCLPSSCGNIHNISHPFRLKGDPKNCGDRRYELDCENNTSTVLYLYSQKYYVKVINYNNTTIRLVDPGVQKNNFYSFPLYSLSEYNFRSAFSDPYTVYKSKWVDNDSFPMITEPVMFTSCPYSVNSSRYVDTAACNCSAFASRGGIHTYAIFGHMEPWDLRDLCSVDLISMTSLALKDDNETLSHSDIHNALIYGFELSWFKCSNCSGYCYLNYANNEICVLNDYCLALGLHFWKRHCGFKEFLTVIALRATQLVILAIAARIVVGMPSTIVFLIIKLRRRHWSVFDNIEGYLQSQNNLTPIRYSYSEIKKMTKNFKDKLGEGGYGSVYKGKLRSGNLVAVKILGKPKSSGQDFISEVSTIGRIHHVNVVQLIGYCAERSKRALVYDFMPNGSLEKHLISGEERTPLSWERKYEIALGVARGIEYLHRGCDMQILHFDIKPHNILLDENFIPKVSDFGLARLYPTDKSIVTLTAVRGTIGYVAPELINRSIGGISYKADVYSFGMLLIEMVGLKKNLAETEESSTQYFPDWIYDRFNKGKDICDGEEAPVDKKITRKMTIVALWCIHMDPVDRPSMTKVMKMLEGDDELLQMPPDRPVFPPQGTSFTGQTSPADSSESATLLSNSLNSISIM